MNALLWLLPILLPLAAAGLALVWPRARGWLMALAPLPGLALGVLGPPGPAPELGWVLLDVRLALDPLSRVLLVMTALLWTAAGVYARDLPGTASGFPALFLLTLAGNVGLLLAGDAVSFYALFALMTFAAYGLVVHDRSPASLRAGRVYLAMAVLGEVALFTGLALAVHEAAAIDLRALGPAVGAAAHRDLIVGLLVVGFGVKVGVVPLHLWLPLAHPAAPVPASAVLSGTIIKAGLVGWLRVLPVGEVALPGWSSALVAVGVVTAFAGVAIGLTQRDPKVNLAYSSVSQMGIITVLVGVSIGVVDGAALAAAAAAVYALHHGFAKGALFLGVGIARRESDPRRHRLQLAGLALAALSLAGLPLTSGAVAKVALKGAVGLLPDASADMVALALSLGAVGTTLLMGRLLFLVARPAAHGSPGPRLVGSWLGVLAAMVAAAWLLPARLLPDVRLSELSPTVVWDGLWPVLLGAALVTAGWWIGRQLPVTVPQVPAGDGVVLLEAVARGFGTAWTGSAAPAVSGAAKRVRAVGRLVYLAVLPGGGMDHIDRRITRWRAAGAWFVLLAVALTAALLSLVRL
jgi:formate hydrogenlyase subunit 3/multisubunit Na+/H+ antiporter MnhD subunit